VTGIGNIKLHIADGSHIILINVLFVPNSTICLISISMATRDSDYSIHFNKNSCWIDDNNTQMTITCGTLLRSKGLYALQLHTPHAEHALAALSSDPGIETWYRCLGHANYQTIKDMARNRLVDGMPITFSTTPPDCDSCILGKQTKTPVPKKREEGPGHRAMWKLEKVWVDLIGPISVSASGNCYVMDILDDYMSKGWSIPLKSKDQAFPELQAWELAREKETGLSVGVYIVDNGELKSKKMEAWIKSCGVQQNFTAPYTSAHIGRVEHRHRTLMAKARTMRIYAGCPPKRGLYPAPTFHMESMWNPCHSMSFQMDSTYSIWNMFWVKSHPNWCFCSMHIPHGMGEIHLESMESIWNIHMESTCNIPQAFHGFQVDSR
jgi:hypothetical protein